MDMIQFQGLSAHMIHHTARCSDNHLYTVFQGPDLSSYILSSVNWKNLNSVHIFTKTSYLIGNLDCQLSRRAENNRL